MYFGIFQNRVWQMTTRLFKNITIFIHLSRNGYICLFFPSPFFFTLKVDDVPCQILRSYHSNTMEVLSRNIDNLAVQQMNTGGGEAGGGKEWQKKQLLKRNI